MTGSPGEDAFPNVATREAFGYLTTEPRAWATVAVARVVAACVAEVTDPAPSKPTDADGLTVTLCTACGRWVAMPAHTPEVSDEAAWALQTEQHWPECPWVLTRGFHTATESAGGERGC